MAPSEHGKRFLSMEGVADEDLEAHVAKRRRLKQAAMEALSGLLQTPSVERIREEVRSLLGGVVRSVVAGAVQGCSDDDEETDPDYRPGDDVETLDAAETLRDMGVRAREEENLVGLFFSALGDEGGCAEMLATELYDRYKRFCVAHAAPVQRSSFGMQLRTIDGVCKRPSPGGTRYTFDWPAIRRHLAGKSGKAY
jgi:hypothetical protein